jgi:hypothetical protein
MASNQKFPKGKQSISNERKRFNDEMDEFWNDCVNIESTSTRPNREGPSEEYITCKYF